MVPAGASAGSGYTLVDVRDRSGTGVVRLTGFTIEDVDGQRSESVQSGMDFDLVFQFKCIESNGMSNADMGFSLHQADETILAVLYSSYTGHKFESIPVTGEFRCRVHQLALKEGRYLVGARIEVDGQEADWPKGMIGEIKVIAGDFYGSGVKGFNGPAPLLLSGSWSVSGTKS